MTRPVRLAIISKADASGGGASRVAELSARLFAPHFDVLHFVLDGREMRPHMRHIRSGLGLTWFERECARLSNYLGVPDFVSIDWLFFLLRSRLQVDLVHCHDISSALSPVSLGLLSRFAPVCWTFHDCSPFTGGCLYPMGCRRFESTCGGCPQLGRWPQTTATDRTAWIQTYKRRLAGRDAFTAICPSTWMARMAVRAGMFDTAPEVIPYYVDPAVFSPVDRRSVRRSLGIPEDRLVVLLSSHALTDTRKGFRLAAAALGRVSDLRPVVLLVGNAAREVTRHLPGLDVITTGYVHDERVLARYYAAADVLLCATLADNLPNVIMECMACGVPTVGFASGGVPEMIEHERSGWLVPPGDVDGLAHGLRLAATPATLADWSEACTRHARVRYSPEMFRQAHEALYSRLLAQRPGRHE